MASIDKLDPLFGQAIFAVKRSFTKVPINPAFTVVIEFQTIDVSTSTHTPKACVPSSHVLLDRYEWLNRMYQVPLDHSATVHPRWFTQCRSLETSHVLPSDAS